MIPPGRDSSNCSRPKAIMLWPPTDQARKQLEGGEDRAQALAYLQSNYGPGGTIAMATRADKTRAGDG